MNQQGGITQRMVNMYHRCTPGQRVEGRRWYDEASNTVLEYANEYELDPERVAGVIATLSPFVTWQQNVESAERVFKAHKRRELMPPMVAGFDRNRQKAWVVLVHGTEVTGPKVTAFKRAMLGDTDSVTLDRWMFRIGFNKEEGNQTERRMLERSLRSAASICGETPRDMQAILWVQIRGKAD